MFTEDILQMLFEEAEADGGMTFTEWVATHPDYASMSDQAIYAALPDYIQAMCGEIGLNASWMHDGM